MVLKVNTIKNLLVFLIVFFSILRGAFALEPLDESQLSDQSASEISLNKDEYSRIEAMINPVSASDEGQSKVVDFNPLSPEHKTENGSIGKDLILHFGFSHHWTLGSNFEKILIENPKYKPYYGDIIINK